MKKKVALVLLSFFILVSGYSTARAVEVSGGASIDVLSNYVWRGQKLSDDNGVIQPSVTAGYDGLALNLWANEDLTNSEHTETDLTLSYSASVDKVSIDVGYIYYALDGADDTQEIYLSLGYDIILSPSLTVYYDYDEGEGGFLVFAVGHSFTLPYNAALNLGASASVNLDNAVMGLDSKGQEFTGFYNGEISASVSVAINENISVEPKVAWSFPLTNDGETAIESVSFDSNSSTVYGGVAFSLAF
ncbi:MAG: TorF family putative porin [Thermodesulfobacteriota bacterium]